MYKAGDIVIAGSPAGEGVPAVHVKLVRRMESKAQKGRTFDWPAYVGWEAVLIKEADVERLRKECCIPFKWPDDVETFVFEKDILKKISPKKRRRRKTRRIKKA